MKTRWCQPAEAANTEEEVRLHLLLASFGTAFSCCNTENKGGAAHSEWQSRTADTWHVPAPTQGLPLLMN